MFDTSSMTTEVPRELGLYLFVGEVYFPNRSKRSQHVEIIHVVYDATGRTMWIGKDVYSPDRLVGAWLRIDEALSPMQQAADNLFVERAALDLVPRLFSYGSTTFDLPKKLEWECGPLADRVLARSIELGVVEDRGGYHILLVKPEGT